MFSRTMYVNLYNLQYIETPNDWVYAGVTLVYVKGTAVYPLIRLQICA